jgi:polysaccharide biosynthesis transport protein
MTVRQMMQLMWARRWLFGAIFMTVVGLTVAVSVILPKTYVAEVSVVIDSKSTDPVSGMERASELMPSNMATQADVITSHNVALKVAEHLHLASSPQLRERFQEATGGAGSIKDWIADLLLKNLDVKPSRESHVLNIDVSAFDPEGAADIANAFADAYIQTSLELKMEPARRQTAWYQEQLQGLRKSVEVAQGHLSDYQRDHAVVGTNEQLDIENARLAEISTQLLTAQATMYEGQTHLRQMKEASQRDQLRALPDILANPLLQGMKADLARAESKLAETGERYGKNHPQYISAAAEVKSLESKLSAELVTAQGSIEQSAQQSAAQVGELRRALDQQRDRILELKRQRDDLDVLRREVDSAQRVYDAALQRATQVRLESQLDQSNIAILNSAVPPLRPARPRLLLNTAVAMVAGVILSAAVVLAVENMDRRVRTTGDLVELAGIPVLAEIPRRSRRRRRQRLLAESSAKLAFRTS